MIENKMTLKMVSKSVAILQRNGEDMVCPFVPPMQIRHRSLNSLGQVTEQVNIQKSPCNSNCPLFQIQQRGNSITLSCSGSDVDYALRNYIPFFDSVLGEITPSTGVLNNNLGKSLSYKKNEDKYKFDLEFDTPKECEMTYTQFINYLYSELYIDKSTYDMALPTTNKKEDNTNNIIKLDR